MEFSYRDRMASYYPRAIQKIYDFQAIVDGIAPEFDELSLAKDQIVNDAYWLTMGEERIAQWENKLGITPLEDSSVEDRREVIIARIRGQGKLNTELIERIVTAFTGSTVTSWIEDSTLCIELHPPKEAKAYKIENLEAELVYKVPAHLGLELIRRYVTWEKINEVNESWKEVNALYDSWEDVLYNNKHSLNQLGLTTFEKFVLG